MSAPVLQFSDVCVEASTGTQSVALLRDISFAVSRGETLGLVGESGAGKSMVGRVLSGLLPANLHFASGEVLFQGERLTAQLARTFLGRRIAFIPQEPLSALNPVFTIGQQFDEHLRYLGIERRLRKAYAAERLAEVGLPEPQRLLGRYPHQLSGGQCQRVLIAMAFCGNPELIIADEPTTALDVVTQIQIIRLLRDIQNKYETAVVLITHDLRLAAHVCNKIAVLYAGDIVESGPARDVLDNPRHPYSWALKMATPPLHGSPYVLPVLPDLMPGLQQMAALPGCRYAPRCAVRDPACAGSRLSLSAVAPGHFVRCSVACRHEPAFDTGLQLRQPFSQPAAEAQPILDLNGVGMRYAIKTPGLSVWQQQRYFTAVHPLSLQVYPGEMVGIVGESGSGKSTLARLMAGLFHPSDGSLLVNGVNPRTASTQQREAMRKTVQMVFQDPDSALNPRRQVESLITQVLELQPGISTAQRREKALQLMQQVGIAPDALGRFSSQLSGGQKQRVNIARALCVAPRLLIADEIVSGLDVSVQALIMNLLLQLNRELGIAVVLISHDLSVIRYLCQRVLVMREGHVVEQGDVEQVFSSPAHPYTRLLLASVPPDDAQSAWPPALADLEAGVACA